MLRGLSSISSFGLSEIDLFLCSQFINLQCMASPSIDDPGRDDTIIVQKFMEELCRRDNEDNRGENRDNEPLEFLDSGVNVQLTNIGRAHCNEYGIHVHLE